MNINFLIMVVAIDSSIDINSTQLIFTLVVQLPIFHHQLLVNLQCRTVLPQQLPIDFLDLLRHLPSLLLFPHHFPLPDAVVLENMLPRKGIDADHDRKNKVNRQLLES